MGRYIWKDYGRSGSGMDKRAFSIHLYIHAYMCIALGGLRNDVVAVNFEYIGIYTVYRLVYVLIVLFVFSTSSHPTTTFLIVYLMLKALCVFQELENSINRKNIE